MKILLYSLTLIVVCAVSGIAEETYVKTYKFSEGKIIIESSGNLPAAPKIGLVLSGGGSRGLVHIGVLKALEKHNIPIDLIVGTSIGSLLGGLYASGYTPEKLHEIMNTINWPDLYKDETQRNTLFLGQISEQDRYLLTIRFNKGRPFIPVGLSAGHKVISILSDFILQAHYQARNDFNNLRIPFRSVATDLISGKQVVLSKGDLAESINASMAFPLLFSPVPMDSMLLVDGGLRSNLPVDVARQEGMDIIIAIDATSGLRSRDRINVPWEIIDQATTIMMDLSKRMEQQAADILINPNLRGLLSDDFSQNDHLVEKGESDTELKIEEIRQKIDSCNYKNNEQIAFFGSNFIAPDSILAGLSINIVDTLTVNEIDIKLLQVLKSGQYKSVQIYVDSTDSAHVQAEPLGLVQNIEITGNTRVESDTLSGMLTTDIGRLLNCIELEQDINRIIEAYRSQGFALMRIKQVQWRKDSGTLVIRINEGIIDDFRIEGNQKTKNYVILREFSKQRGSVFNWKRIKTAVQNVYASQLYERVNTHMKEENGQNVLIIKVKERSSQLLRLGGKFDFDRGAQAYIELGDESIFGLGIKTMLQTRFGQKDGHIGVRIRDDKVFFTNFTYDLNGYYSWEINPLEDGDGSYREERRGFRFSMGRQVRRIGQLVFELRNENITDKKNKNTFTNEQNIELRTFAVRALSDKLDRADFPTKGIYNHWAWETGNRLVLETSESYTKALLNLEGYYDVTDAHNWHVRLFVGIGDKTVPFSENFRLGGLNEFYGLRKNQLYGRQLFTFNLEYRYKLPIHFSKSNFLLKDSYISGRYDFGGIWKNPAVVFDSDDFFSGAGLNLGIETLFGPMHIAYGKSTRGDGIFYFSVGFNY